MPSFPGQPCTGRSWIRSSQWTEAEEQDSAETAKKGVAGAELGVLDELTGLAEVQMLSKGSTTEPTGIASIAAIRSTTSDLEALPRPGSAQHLPICRQC